MATRRGREAETAVLLEGPKVIRTVLDLGIVPLFAVREAGRTSAEIETLSTRLDRMGVEVVEVEAPQMQDLATTEAPQGILMVASEPRSSLPAPERSPDARCLVLDAVQDPGNVGTLVRAAAALGVDRVFALDGTADPWGAKAVRASAGLVFGLPIHLLPWVEAISWIEEARLPLLVAERSGEDLREWIAGGQGQAWRGWALLLGNEGRGVRADVSAHGHAKLAIPITGGADSLNVSSAGAILLWSLGPGREDRNVKPEGVR
ncbi:MAG: RNA methyltransferase [Gemmatimonadota bacterium]